MNFTSYDTIRATVTGEITITRSTFLAYLHPCVSKEQAQQLLEELRSKHWDAVHHCYAWRIGPNGMDYRMSDDGEPSGTAGKPLLFALQRAQLSDVLLVVVRYYGGVKLGVGPLARAYAESGQVAIDACERIIVRDMSRATVFCLYDDVSTVTRTLEEYEAKFTATYADAITFDVEVASEHIDVLIEAITSRTNARAGSLKISAE